MKRSVLILAVVLAAIVISADVYPQAKKPEKATDPVCGLSVDKNPDLSATHSNTTYYFCSRADMDAFKKNPDKYIKK